MGEAGEYAEKVKKKYRRTSLISAPETMGKELGDVLWYLARLAALHGFKMTDIMEMNVDKLESRAARGVLQGEGDNR